MLPNPNLSTEAGQLQYDWGGLKYFLYQYEEHLAQKSGARPRVGWEEIRDRDKKDTIEHILPQEPSDPYWMDRFKDDERRRLVHELGNLTLTKDNSSYGNKAFPEKRGEAGWDRPCYANSSLYQERELALLEDWTPSEVRARQEKLVAWAEERWGLGDAEEAEVLAEPMDADEGDEVTDRAAVG